LKGRGGCAWIPWGFNDAERTRTARVCGGGRGGSRAALSAETDAPCARRPRDAWHPVRETGAWCEARGPAHDEVGVRGRTRTGRSDDGPLSRSWGPRTGQDRDDGETPDATRGTAVGLGEADTIGGGRVVRIGGPARRAPRRGGGGARRPSGVEVSPPGGTGEAVVAALGEAAWAHVRKDPCEERRRGPCAAHHLSGATLPIPERDVPVGERLEAPGGDRDPAHVAAEGFAHPVSGTRGLHLDDPVARPGAGRDLIGQCGPAQGVVHRAATDGREDVAGEEAVGSWRGNPARAVGRESPHR